MESLLPTEIARLVYGYLIEENCEGAAQLLLETSVHLKECLLVVKKGRRFNTRVSDYSLVDILDKLCEVTCIVKAHLDNLPEVESENVLLQKLRALLVPPDVKRIRRNCYPNISQITSDEKNIDTGVKQSSVADLSEAFQTALGTTEKCFPDNQQEIINQDLGGSTPMCNDNHFPINRGAVKDILAPGSCIQPKEVSLPKHHDKSQNNENLGNQGHLPNYDNNFGQTALNITQRIDGHASNIRNINEFRLESGSVAENRENYLNESQNNQTNSVPLLPITMPSSAKQVSSLVIPPLVFFEQLSLNPNSQFGTSNLRMQMNSLPNCEVTKENVSIPKLQPITNKNENNLMPPLITAPAPIYMKPQVISPIVTNIYANGKVPMKRNPVLLVKTVSTTPSVGGCETDSTLKDSSTVPLKENVDATSDKVLDGPVIIKRSGVRTRGGKSGGKVQRLKALLPKKHVPVEKSDLNPEEEAHEVQRDQSSKNLPSLTSDNCGSSPIVLSAETNIENQTKDDKETHSTSEGKRSDKPASPKPSPSTVAKSEIATRTFRKRISLSVPRRGSHVRALEFKTPTKGGSYRRALTSPKQLLSNRLPSSKKTLKCVRVSLFKSTPLKKDGKAWDADLRKCFSESTNSSSAASKKRNAKNTIETNEEPHASNKKTSNIAFEKEFVSDKLPTLSPKEVENYSPDKCQKSDLSVIVEEDINASDTDLDRMLNSGAHSAPSKPDVSLGTVALGTLDTCRRLVGEAPQPEPVSNQDIPASLGFNSTLNSESIQAALANRPDPPTRFMTPLSKILPEQREIFDKQTLTSKLPEQTIFMTPLSKALHEHREFLENTTLLTPGTPVGDNFRNNKNTHTETPLLKISSPCLNLSSQDSLEASLIKECTRIERENSRKIPGDTVECNTKSMMESIFVATKPKSCIEMGSKGLDSVTASESYEKSLTVHSTPYKLEKHSSKTLFPSSIFTPEKTSDEIIPTSTLQNQLLRDSSSPNENACSKGEVSYEFSDFQENSSLPKSEKFVNKKELMNSDQVPDEMRIISAKNDVSPQQHDTRSERILRSSSRSAKRKKNEPNNDIDTTKLIEQCIQSVKEKLYSINKSSASSPEDTERVAKKESCKTSKRKTSLKVKSSSKMRNSSFSTSSTDEIFQSKKMITSLLSSDSDSSSSSDELDLSAVIHKEDERNKLSVLRKADQISTKSATGEDSDSEDNTRLKVKTCDVKKSQQKQSNLLKIFSKSLNKQSCSSKLDKNLPRHGNKKEIEISKSAKESCVKLDSNSSSESEEDRSSPVKSGHKDVDASHVNVKSDCSAADVKLIKETRVKPCISNSSSSESDEDRATSVRGGNQDVETTKINEKINCTTADMKSIENESPMKSVAINISKYSNDTDIKSTSDLLNDFVYTFALKLDGENVTKQLRISPFYSIFELDSKKLKTVSNSKTENAERSSLMSGAESGKKTNKRKHESEPESPENQWNSDAINDERKTSPVRKHKRTKDHSSEESRRAERGVRWYNEPKRSLRNFNRHYYAEPYNQKHRGKYREKPSRYKRYESSRIRTPNHSVSKRDTEHRRSESPRRGSYRSNDSNNSSNRKHKDRTDSKKHKEISKPRNVSPRNKFDSSKNCTNNFSTDSSKEKKGKRILADKEDGEISESSLSAYSSMPAAAASSQRPVTKTNLPAIDEDTRAILRTLNLDQFLSILHGSEK